MSSQILKLDRHIQVELMLLWLKKKDNGCPWEKKDRRDEFVNFLANIDRNEEEQDHYGEMCHKKYCSSAKKGGKLIFNNYSKIVCKNNTYDDQETTKGEPKLKLLPKLHMKTPKNKEMELANLTSQKINFDNS